MTSQFTAPVQQHNDDSRPRRARTVILNLHPDLESWAVGLADRGIGVPHCWVHAWTGPNVAALQADALAAGWEWLLVDDPTVTPAFPRIYDPLYRLLADDRLHLTEDGPGTVADLADRAHTAAADRRRILLAVGPGFDARNPDLHTLARLGRTAGIHLAVSAALAIPGRAPQEFLDNVRGYWQRCTVTPHPSGGISIRLTTATPTHREHLGDTVTVSLNADGAVVRIDLTANTLDVDALTTRYRISRPLQLLLAHQFTPVQCPTNKAR